MNTWNVVLKFANGKEKNLELFDAKRYFNGYLKIKRSYFNRLIKAVKMTKKYTTVHAIEEVVAPDKENWTLNAWMLISAVDNERQNPFWLFIKREKDLSGYLIAIGPKSFYDYSNIDINEAKRDLKRLINYIIAYLNKFNCTIFLPNYL
jgi:hypothetical protein